MLTETLQLCRYQLLSQNTFSRRFPTPSKLIASVYKFSFFPSRTSYNRVQWLIPSCKGTSDLEINTTALAWECSGTRIAHELSMWQEFSHTTIVKVEGRECQACMTTSKSSILETISYDTAKTIGCRGFEPNWQSNIPEVSTMLIYCHPRFGVGLLISANETAWIVYKFLYVEENIIQTNQMWRTSLSWIQYTCNYVFNVPVYPNFQFSRKPLSNDLLPDHVQWPPFGSRNAPSFTRNLPEDYKGSMSARSMIQRYTTSKQGEVKWESLNCKTFSKSITRSNFHLRSSVLSAALNHLDELPVRKVYYLSFFL